MSDCEIQGQQSCAYFVPPRRTCNAPNLHLPPSDSQYVRCRDPRRLCIAIRCQDRSTLALGSKNGNVRLINRYCNLKIGWLLDTSYNHGLQILLEAGRNCKSNSLILPASESFSCRSSSSFLVAALAFLTDRFSFRGSSSDTDASSKGRNAAFARPPRLTMKRVKSARHASFPVRPLNKCPRYILGNSGG